MAVAECEIRENLAKNYRVVTARHRPILERPFNVAPRAVDLLAL